MRNTDIVIIGGGLAGSTAGAMLSRAGIRAVLIDPHKIYPPDFRCEKLDVSQVDLLRKTGLADAILPAATLDDQISVARLGRMVEKRTTAQYGILYDTLVNTMRAQIKPNVEVLETKATEISTSSDRQTIVLSNGETISARLVVLANGLNIGLRQKLGIERKVISENHSITIGFDVMPKGKAQFDFRALTYFPQRASDHMAYLSLFPIGETMRANLFVYRDVRDPWLREMRKTPEQALLTLMPGLHRLTGDFTITGDVKIRPADLYVTEGHREAGIVLVGDAFGTSCPAAGTGTNKVFNDIERLCNVHIPQWLASEGMGEEKIAAFYDDPAKTACDAFSLNKAFYLRDLSVRTGFVWRVRRGARFLAQLSIGAWQRSFSARPIRQHGVTAGTGVQS